MSRVGLAELGAGGWLGLASVRGSSDRTYRGVLLTWPGGLGSIPFRGLLPSQVITARPGYFLYLPLWVCRGLSGVFFK